MPRTRGQLAAALGIAGLVCITGSLAIPQGPPAQAHPAPVLAVFDDTLSGTLPPPIQGPSVAAAGAMAAPVPQGPYGVTTSAALTGSGMPAEAYRAYTSAAAVLRVTDPRCGLPWSVIAGIGRVESNHGRFGGATIGPDGVVRPAILGIRLDGSRPGTTRINDSDGGRYDGDPLFDRAVGPMQFLPGTWQTYGAGADPQNIGAAALATGKYLCAGDSVLTTAAGQWAAVYRYNHSDSYVSLVLSLAAAYTSGQPATFPSRPVGTTPDNSTPPATAPGRPPAVPAPPNPGFTAGPTTRPSVGPAPTGRPTAPPTGSSTTGPGDGTRPPVPTASASTPATPPGTAPVTTPGTAPTTPPASTAPPSDPTTSAPPTSAPATTSPGTDPPAR